MSLTKPALDPRTIEALNRSGYPEPYRSRVLPRCKRRIGDALGLTRIGINYTRLPPGKTNDLSGASLSFIASISRSKRST